MKNTRWLYLTDMTSGGATIWNPETGERRTITVAAVKDRAPGGLRRMVLEEGQGGMYRETREMVPATPELLAECDEVYRPRNNFNYEWPHFPTELGETPEHRARLADFLIKSMLPYPYDFDLIALQRRYLLYFSDGSMGTQKRFIGLAPAPTDRSPFRRDDRLRSQYLHVYTSEMRDAKAPVPDELRRAGEGRPLLYSGPAWAVRFMLDGQITLLEHCIVYIDDNGGFICSDWCQRHDFLSYSGGINLQTGIYTFDGWVTGPSIIYSRKHGFKPKRTQYSVHQVRELMKKAPPEIPSLTEAMKSAEAKLAAESPVPVSLLKDWLDRAEKDSPTEITSPLSWVNAALTQMSQAVGDGQLGQLDNVPILVPKIRVPEKLQESLEKYVAPGEMYRFPAGPREKCGANVPPTDYCVTSVGRHLHFKVSETLIDAKQVREELLPLAEQRWAARLATVDPGPITAEILEEASAIMKLRETELVRVLEGRKLARQLMPPVVLPPREIHIGGKPFRVKADELPGVLQITLVQTGEVIFVRRTPEATLEATASLRIDDPVAKIVPLAAHAPAAQAASLFWQEMEAARQASMHEAAVAFALADNETLALCTPTGDGVEVRFRLPSAATIGDQRYALVQGSTGAIFEKTATGYVPAAGVLLEAGQRYFDAYAPVSVNLPGQALAAFMKPVFQTFTILGPARSVGFTPRGDGWVEVRDPSLANTPYAVWYGRELPDDAGYEITYDVEKLKSPPGTCESAEGFRPFLEWYFSRLAVAKAA